jgi:hypothetical protein
MTSFLFELLAGLPVRETEGTVTLETAATIVMTTPLSAIAVVAAVSVIVAAVLAAVAAAATVAAAAVYLYQDQVTSTETVNRTPPASQLRRSRTF